jgi:hypothetical protein
LFNELQEVEGFLEEIHPIHAGKPGPGIPFRLTEEEEARPRAKAPNLLDYCGPGLVRQVQVENDHLDVVGVLAECLHALAAIPGEEDGEAKGFQGGLHRPPQGFLGVHIEHRP